MNIPDDRVLQLTQQILELGDVKIDGHPVSASKVPIQPIVHGSCMVHGCMAEQGEGICCIEPGSSPTFSSVFNKSGVWVWVGGGRLVE